MALTPETLVSCNNSVGAFSDPPALQELGSVEWSAVSHAHGHANDVPALLRALVSDESDHRGFALQLLFETIWHQGTIYQATAQTIPFLYNLLEADGPHDKAGVACLLASIAEGRPSFAACEGDPKETELWRGILEKQGRSLEEEMMQGKMYVAEIGHQLLHRIDLLLPFLRYPDPTVRNCIAAAYGQFPDVVERLLPILQEALHTESDESVRNTLQQTINRRTIR